MVGLLNVQHSAILLASNGEYRRAEAYPADGRHAAWLKPYKAVQADLQMGKAVSQKQPQGL
ncbi:MAG: hypothetical protein WEA61_02935 [Anaerolineales bacterium]